MTMTLERLDAMENAINGGFLIRAADVKNLIAFAKDCLTPMVPPISTREMRAMLDDPTIFTENRYHFECGVCHRHFLGHKGRCICDGCKSPA